MLRRRCNGCAPVCAGASSSTIPAAVPDRRMRGGEPRVGSSRALDRAVRPTAEAVVDPLCVRATAFLLLVACRPEPAPFVAPEPLPEATVAIGIAVVIEELGEGFVHRANVDAQGRIEAMPLCGPTLVDGATAPQICDRLASCMAAVLREPLVRIAFEESRASCSAEGEPMPADDELLDAVAARLARTRADDMLVAE